MTPEDWQPSELPEGRVDGKAREIAFEIGRSMPATLEEAIKLLGPLEITHISPREPHPSGWIKLYFITALRQKTDVFFVGFEYMMPYFRQWVEYHFEGHQFSKLLKPIEVPAILDRVPWLTQDGDIMLAHKSDPFHKALQRIGPIADLVG